MALLMALCFQSKVYGGDPTNGVKSMTFSTDCKL